MATNEKYQPKIPEMVDPLGKHWDQPDKSGIQFINNVAHMSRVSFDLLKNYSYSDPSGVYDGKMWKCESFNKWYLRWYSGKNEYTCHINTKRIHIT